MFELNFLFKTEKLQDTIIFYFLSIIYQYLQILILRNVCPSDCCEEKTEIKCIRNDT